MPANLPPEYYEAERLYKEAQGHQAKIAALENLISTVPKHKGTDKLRADMRRRLSKLRTEGAKSKKSGKGDLFSVQKEGAEQVVLVGHPNAGKSSLLAALTNASPMIADYPMTTVMPLPGMMPYEDILFQLVDLPPVGFEATDGWVSGIIRNAGLILLVVDLSDAPEAQVSLLLDQLSEWNIIDRRIVIVATKADTPDTKEPLSLLSGTYGEKYPVVPISIKTKEGIDDLRKTVFMASGIIRIYTKEPGKKADLNQPFTMKEGTTIQDLGERIHKDFSTNLKFACVWGSVKIQGQRVQRDYVLQDKDVVEFHI